MLSIPQYKVLHKLLSFILHQTLYMAYQTYLGKHPINTAGHSPHCYNVMPHHHRTGHTVRACLQNYSMNWKHRLYSTNVK